MGVSLHVFFKVIPIDCPNKQFSFIVYPSMADGSDRIRYLTKVRKIAPTDML